MTRNSHTVKTEVMNGYMLLWENQWSKRLSGNPSAQGMGERKNIAVGRNQKWEDEGQVLSQNLQGEDAECNSKSKPDTIRKVAYRGAMRYGESFRDTEVRLP